MKLFLSLIATVVMLSVPAYADITIGLVGPFTGSVALGGEQIKRGAEQAVADINAAGGINGEKLVLYPADDACDPKQAVSAANKIASAGIKFVAGFYCSGSAIPASKVYMDEGMLMVVAGASNPRLTDEAKDLVLRSYNRDDNEGAYIASYILKHYPNKKIALVNDKSAWGVGLSQEVQKDLNKANVKEVLFDSYTPGERDYSAIVAKLKEVHADVLLLAGFPTEAGMILRQMKEQGANMQVIGGDALTNNQLWSIAGNSADGLLMSFTTDPRKKPEAKTVVEEFRKQGYDPEGDTLYAYAAIQTLAEGIKRVGKNDPLKLAQTVRQAGVPTILGNMQYDAKGDAMGLTFAMYRWHDGKYAETGE
jgi:branched-chain amino acid transport system substrate-binding protein